MRWFLVLGGLGVIPFIVELIDGRLPDGLLLVGLLMCTVSCYGVLALRGRARGESFLESLEYRYASRLRWYERAFSTVLGLGLIALSFPIALSWDFIGSAFVGVWALWIAISDKPPYGAVGETTACDERSL